MSIRASLPIPILVALAAVGCLRNQVAMQPVPPTGQKVSVVPGDDAATAAAVNEKRFEDHGDGTITDRLTGLTWERKCTNCGPLHDVNTSFRWVDTAPDPFEGWLADLNAENGTGFAGHDDWRLPTAMELIGIVDYGRDPEAGKETIDPVFGPTHTWGSYWTATTAPGKTARRFTVTFTDGSSGTDVRGEKYVRAVRGTAPAASWRDNGDGTVTDLVTGLMWERKCEDCADGLHQLGSSFSWEPDQPGSIWTWVQEINAEGGTGYAGHADWRIPNVKELATLVRFDLPPVDDQVAFEPTLGTVENPYWSSTAAARKKNSAWMLKPSGEVSAAGRGNRLMVRAVRQPLPGEAAPRASDAVAAKRAAAQAKEQAMPAGCRLPDARLAKVLAQPDVQRLQAEIAQIAVMLAGVPTLKQRDDGSWPDADAVAAKERGGMVQGLLTQDERDRREILAAIARAGAGDEAAARSALRDVCVVVDFGGGHTRSDATGGDLYMVMLARPWSREAPAAMVLAGVTSASGSSAASREAGESLVGQAVRCELEPAADKADRRRAEKTGYLYAADGALVNADLIRQGTGRLDSDGHLAQHAALAAADAEARVKHRGIWAPQVVHLQRAREGGRCDWRGEPMLRLEGGSDVRLIGVLPARQPRIDDATCTALWQRVDGQQAFIEVDPNLGEYAGQYVVMADGLLLNAEVLRLGIGRLDVKALQRAPARGDALVAAEHEARADGRGVWANNQITGLETDANCPLGLEPDAHEHCHLYRLEDGANVGLLGVRLPTWTEYLHKEARQRAAELVAGTQPTQMFDSAADDPPGCDRAYLTLGDGRMVNLELVREGLARADVGDRPLREAAALRAAEQDARQAKRGVWGADVVVSARVGEGVASIMLRDGRHIHNFAGVRIPSLGRQHGEAASALFKRMLEPGLGDVTTDPAIANLAAHGDEYVTLADGRSLNVELVRQGLGYVEVIDHPYRLKDELLAAEQEARREGRGIWAAHEIIGGSIQGEYTIVILRNGDAHYDPPGLTVALLGIDYWGGHLSKTGAVLKELTTGQKAHLGFDPTVWREPVLTPAYVALDDGRSLNVALLRQGVARVAPRKGMPPLSQQAELAAAQRAAKDEERGMWSRIAVAPDPMPTLDPEAVARALAPPKWRQGTIREMMPGDPLGGQ